AAGWDKTQLFQCDWSSNFTDNALDDLLWTMNFGTGANIEKEFKKVGEMRPDAPKMCSEFWSGWFDNYGYPHQTRPYEPMVNGIKDMLDRNISFSLYMTHGGTSFGQWAGANVPGYQPDCTSYDYDAPINEQGSVTEKYWKLRELLQNYSDKKLPAVPKAKPIVAVPEFKLTEFAPLYAAENQPKAIQSRDIKPMEQFNMGYGSTLYSCQLPKTQEEGLLVIKDMCDYAVVFVDGKLIGRLYRGNGAENTLRMPKLPQGGKLEIFIESMGRINYSKLIFDPKGITESVELKTAVPGAEVTYNLKNWDVQLFPVCYDFAKGMNYKPVSEVADKITADAQNVDPRNLAGFYKGTFKVSKVGDTYLDLSKWSKGLVWVNGKCLGRFWNVGPQQTMFLPGCWLKKGVNEVIVMDIVGPNAAPALAGLKEPSIADLHKENMPQDAVKGIETGKKSKKNAAEVAGNDAAPGAK
ncbi:MAG: beta-galactosidase, partial [Bacteroidales bacterium]|nr:beta-galactosidase [Bacteroidales bacterium]